MKSFVTPLTSSNFRLRRCAYRSIVIPAVVEHTPQYERVMDIYSRLLRERIICLHGAVDDQLASLVTSQLLFLEAEDPDTPINMYINSPGGSVSAGLSIYDTMQYIKPKVSTICTGQASSMGSLLLTGGSPGLRYCTPNSRIMVHQPSTSGGMAGNASDIKIMADELLRTRARLNALYCFHTNQSLAEVEKVMERDTFMSAEEALRFGIVDSVLSTRPGSEKKIADLSSLK